MFRKTSRDFLTIPIFFRFPKICQHFLHHTRVKREKQGSKQNQCLIFNFKRILTKYELYYLTNAGYKLHECIFTPCKFPFLTKSAFYSLFVLFIPLRV